MGCLGGFRAITKETLENLRAVPRADRVPDYLDEWIPWTASTWTKPGTPCTGRCAEAS